MKQMKQIQFFTRQAGMPFQYGLQSYPNAVLVLSGIIMRTEEVHIFASAYADATAAELSPAAPLVRYSYIFTAEHLRIMPENRTVEGVTLESLNLPLAYAMWAFDTSFRSGVKLTTRGLNAILLLPSATEGRSLGDEWTIPQ